MARPKAAPTGREIFFDSEEIIVSKTDLRGIITYANDVFLKVSGYEEQELIGQPHNILRHPGMPACVFRLLWDTIKGGNEIFAYVLNLAANGDHYWVFAHVTPSFDASGRHVGYHSNRRVPYTDALDQVKPLYAQLLEIENRAPNKQVGIDSGVAHLSSLLSKSGVDYSQFVFSLSNQTKLCSAA